MNDMKRLNLNFSLLFNWMVSRLLGCIVVLETNQFNTKIRRMKKSNTQQFVDYTVYTVEIEKDENEIFRSKIKFLNWV